MMRATLLSAMLAATLLAATAAPVAADSSFSSLIRGCPLVVLADVTVNADGGVVLHVEQVLKGHAGSVLRFPKSSSAVEPGWARAVVAFFNPSTIARGVTFVWHVTASGAVDPERYAQFPGMPQTLAAMLAWFGEAPATDTQRAAGAIPGPDWRLALLALAGLAGFVGAVRYRRPSR
jgi:hypothetical protein